MGRVVNESMIQKEFDDCILELMYDKDFLNAYITVKNEVYKSTLEEIEVFLQENNVVYGIDKSEILNILTSEQVDVKFNVAKGVEPIKGEDAYIKYLFDTEEKINLEADYKGTINFKELNYIKNIECDVVLAKKVEPTCGVDGINVFGDVIEALNGKDIMFKLGKNVYLSDDGLTVLSKIQGRVQLVDSKIEVSNVLTISGNVDASTGNIRFNGDVVVTEDIKAGYVVESTGDIHVGGVIESASVKCKGNLIVKNGIQGNDKEIVYCSGDLICKYIENARIICEKNLISDVIIHSDILCMANITAGVKKGLIAGGEIKAKDEIRCNVLGAPMGTRTNIEVGVNPKIKFELKRKIHEKNELEKNMLDMSININFYKDLLNKNRINESGKNKLLNLLNKYNESSKLIGELNKHIEKIEKEIKENKNGKITVDNKLHAGVKITVGNATKYIKEDMNSCCIFLENKNVVTRSK